MAISENKRMEELFYIGESGIIKFAQAIGTPSCDRLSELAGIPYIYTDYPADIKSREMINEVGLKIIKNTSDGEEYEKILENSIIYFMIAQDVVGRVASYLAVTSSGIFQNSHLPNCRYIPKSNIKSIGMGETNIAVSMSDGTTAYITVSTLKNMKAYNEKIVSLLNYLYLEAPQPEIREAPQEYEDGANIQTGFTQANNSDAAMYHLVSSRGVTRGIVSGLIESKVYFADDHMEIATSPKRLNTLPVINYSDIATVQKSVFFSWYSVVMAILFAAFCFIGQFYMLIFSALMLYFGINHRITINLRNGASTKLYSHKKKYAEMCLADIQKRIS